jgi:hypothetical protein
MKVRVNESGQQGAAVEVDSACRCGFEGPIGYLDNGAPLDEDMAAEPGLTRLEIQKAGILENQHPNQSW